MPPTKPTPEIFCGHCQKRLERKRYGKRLEDLAVFKRRKFCDKECMARGFEAKPKKADPSWMTAHYHARKIKPPGPCEKCGATGKTDVHHINENWRDNSLENLMRLCRSCHLREHNGNRPRASDA